MRNALESDSNDIEVNRATRWLFASAAVVFLCGVLAIVLPLTFSLGVAGLLGWLFYLRGRCSCYFWNSFRKRHPSLACVDRRVVRPGCNQFIGESAARSGPSRLADRRSSHCRRDHRDCSFFALRDYRHAIWILIDGIVTLVLGIVACAHWPPANPELIQYLVGISFISSGISRLWCWRSQFASSSQQEGRLREAKLGRASRLASRVGERRVTFSDSGPRLGLAVDRFCAVAVFRCLAAQMECGCATVAGIRELSARRIALSVLCLCSAMSIAAFNSGAV